MATVCDVSFDEMAVALSYISLGVGTAAPTSVVPVSTDRGLPAKGSKPAPADTAKPASGTKEKGASKADEDDDVRICHDLNS